MKTTDATDVLQRAVRNGLPKYRGQYHKVAVLFLHWSNDDIGVIGLEREFAMVFSQLFKYIVEVFEIDAFPARHHFTQNLSRRLMDFAGAHQGPQNLLIYVY